MTRAAPALLLLLALACGKYGPPVRAGQASAERAAPSLEVPLPLGEGEPAPAPGASPAPAPETEPEPPPEGAP